MRKDITGASTNDCNLQFTNIDNEVVVEFELRNLRAWINGDGVEVSDDSNKFHVSGELITDFGYASPQLFIDYLDALRDNCQTQIISTNTLSTIVVVHSHFFDNTAGTLTSENAKRVSVWNSGNQNGYITFPGGNPVKIPHGYHGQIVLFESIYNPSSNVFSECPDITYDATGTELNFIQQM